MRVLVEQTKQVAQTLASQMPAEQRPDVHVLPGICLDSAAAPLPELSLTLEPAALGLSMRTGASWRERCNSLLARFGPCGLAFLESVLRAADVRASRLKTNDPVFSHGESEAT